MDGNAIEYVENPEPLTDDEPGPGLGHPKMYTTTGEAAFAGAAIRTGQYGGEASGRARRYTGIAVTRLAKPGDMRGSRKYARPVRRRGPCACEAREQARPVCM